MLRSIYQGTRAMHSAVKDANRLREIATVLARYGFGALFERVNIGIRPPTVDSVSTDAFEERVVKALQELGPTFVKFGQIMSTRPDVIAPSLCEKLQRLQDQVSEVAYARIAEQIEAELGAAPEKIFAEFSKKPLASASIAQVHQATTQTGDDVIVKVRRPGIARTIDADLSIMHMLSRRIEEAAPEARIFNLSGMVQEFERSLRREIDFSLEATSIERFGKNFADDSRVFIPRVFIDLSSQAVLTMERVHGTKISEVQGDAASRDRIARNYLYAAYKMIFEDGFFHGDMHPGNVFVDADQRIALVDFGMVGRLSGSTRDRIVDVLNALLREDLEEVARTFFDLGQALGPVDYPTFEAEVVDVMERNFVGNTISEIQFGAFFAELVDGALKHHIRMPADYTMLFKALLTTEGLARHLAPDVNPVELARPFVENLVRQRYSPERLKRQALHSAARATSFFNVALSSGQRIMQSIEQGNSRFIVEDKGLRDATVRLARARERQNLLLIAGLLILAATVIHPAQGPMIWGLSLPSLVLMVLAAVIVGRVLFGQMQKDDSDSPWRQP